MIHFLCCPLQKICFVNQLLAKSAGAAMLIRSETSLASPNLTQVSTLIVNFLFFLVITLVQKIFILNYYKF